MLPQVFAATLTRGGRMNNAAYIGRCLRCMVYVVLANSCRICYTLYASHDGASVSVRPRKTCSDEARIYQRALIAGLVSACDEGKKRNVETKKVYQN